MLQSFWHYVSCPTWEVPLQVDICDSAHHSSAESGLRTQGVLCCVEHSLYQIILLLPDWTQITVRGSLLFTILLLANKVHQQDFAAYTLTASNQGHVLVILQQPADL